MILKTRARRRHATVLDCDGCIKEERFTLVGVKRSLDHLAELRKYRVAVWASVNFLSSDSALGLTISVCVEYRLIRQ